MSEHSSQPESGNRAESDHVAVGSDPLNSHTTNASDATPVDPLDSCQEARDRYRGQLSSIDAELQQYSATDSKFGTVRVTLFFAMVIGIGFSTTTGHPFWIAVAIVAFLAFLVAVVKNETVRMQIEIRQNEARTLRRLCARLDRDWATLVADPIGQISDVVKLNERQRYLAGDLDLLGDSSLFQLVSMAATTPGQRTLAGWLTEPVDPAVAQDRHHAVAALADQRDARLRFYTLAREVGTSTGDPESFVQWASSPPWLPSRRWLSPWSNLTAVASVLCLIALVAATLMQDRDLTRISFFALIGIAVLNLSIASLMLGPVAQIFSVAIQSRRSVDDYAELFQSAELLPTDAPEGASSNELTARIRRTFLGDPGHGGQSAGLAMRELGSIAKAGALKHSAATFLIYLPLQAFGLWDVRVLRRLEEWKERYAKNAEDWFTSLGELESLLSLAALADEYPRWAAPQWSAGGFDSKNNSDSADDSIVRCERLGHPLLQDTMRVRNDVSIGPAGTLLLVTGSNMSGKSTMLRSVGLNVSLAMAGAPVCCSAMRLPAIEMATSIRVSDDLSQGVSFYMAELNRLAAVVEHARQLHRSAQAEAANGSSQRRESPRRLLFLLDEILQGTNSRERQIAVTRVLGMLVESGAIGAITTHDLELADEPELMRIAHTVHFRETITPDADGDERMTFDYRMRDGVSPTTNALRLLEMVGLGEESS
ncbi:MutS family DNA mismatch repair protein [Rhodopirellula sallentina]|uniref:DNA mismatch repair protein MutS domain-containing protein n=1 Tax=Rhodopirellula sallentina SM41 TaxID=1263870 RepID=M5TXN9_9BACT|nr:MutS family DNA mismatch repair protein [Rhodopirellula sallentina]EMI53992.1 DNA mismatch repair protein MutS domain-containing protein [Rhodopirellula sallentina SM41]